VEAEEVVLVEVVAVEVVFVEGVPQGVEEVLLGVDVVVSGEGEDSKGISTSCNISCFLQSFSLDYHIVLFQLKFDAELTFYLTYYELNGSI
jgi:hypothetical protein